ncbi:P-loop containing nucleoside triphosphate hydrolase protein, partial [Ochromonadaceae sp. CCMP2298]
NGKKPKTGSFQALGLDREVLNAINRMGYKTPTPIQRKSLPLAMAGIDLVCMARTGSGKTCAFLLPMVQMLRTHKPGGGVRGIVLSPTRELAVQTWKFARDFAKFTDLNIVNIFGGDGIEAQFEALSSRPDIIIATPGRLMHHLREISTFKLNQVQMLVFDEADRLFEMGFAEQLNEIVRECPVERQTLLFSATMPKALMQFSRAGLRDPQLVRLDTDNQLSEELRLSFFSVRSNEKLAAFLYLVRRIIPESQVTIVFTATRHHSELLHALLEHIHVSSTIVYGSMDQEARSTHLKNFRQGSIRYLIVTDLAARGIDVPLLNNVINFHFPPTPKLFIHRCGRAARQGRIGYAFSLVEPEELGFMVDVHTYLGKQLHMCSVEGEEEAEDSLFVPAYTLENMVPSQIHVGLLPQDVLAQENDYVKRTFEGEEELEIMNRISENGMKQFRRTRTEATREGVKKAKFLIKQGLIKHIHPLIAGCDPDNCSSQVVQKNEYVRMLQTFRPAQTVFETGIGTGTGSYHAKINGGSMPQQQSSRTKLAKGAEMMTALRKATVASLERNRVAIAAEQQQALAEMKSASGRAGESDDEESGNESQEEESLEDEAGSTDEYYNDDNASVHYMDYGDEDAHASFAEDSMQPRADAMKMEQALLDISPDDAVDLNNKRRIMRWDAKKNKFVKQTLAEMAEVRGKGVKRIRSENGFISKKSATPQGEMYEKWKKRTRREIGG